jgi:CheY-like chemotaxis protein
MESNPAPDKSVPPIAHAIHAMLDRHGVPERKHLMVLEAALGMAYQQVRRRMLGDTSWGSDELRRLASHFAEPVLSLLGSWVDKETGQRATLQVGGTAQVCFFWPAAEAERVGVFVAVPGEDADDWKVILATEAGSRPTVGIRRLLLELAPPRRVAVIDEDANTVDAIVEFLRLKGLDAVSFTQAEQLRTALETTNFDGFILEWVLGDDRAIDLLPLIRRKNPTGPVIILTGQVGVGVQESEIAQATANYRAQLYEKPSRALSLFNALQLGFEKSPRVTGGRLPLPDGESGAPSSAGAV